MNLYKQINDWLIAKYAPFNNWIYFNATPMFAGAVTMNSVAGQRIVKKFIDKLDAKYFVAESQTLL